MRLWSIHPKYLDPKGLVALWREALLAKKALEGKTRHYRNHPQLTRFKEHSNLIAAINSFLREVFREACSRGYCFNKRLIGKGFTRKKIAVSDAQLKYEFLHLKKKLKKRHSKKYSELKKTKRILPNPFFATKKGPVADWEKR